MAEELQTMSLPQPIANRTSQTSRPDLRVWRFRQVFRSLGDFPCSSLVSVGGPDYPTTANHQLVGLGSLRPARATPPVMAIDTGRPPARPARHATRHGRHAGRRDRQLGSPSRRIARRTSSRCPPSLRFRASRLATPPARHGVARRCGRLAAICSDLHASALRGCPSAPRHQSRPSRATPALRDRLASRVNASSPPVYRTRTRRRR